MPKLMTLTLVILASSIISCAPTFVRTGPIYDQLPENALVQVFLGEKRPTNYIELGAVRIKGGGLFKDPLADAVEKAKKIARKNGGNCVLLSMHHTESYVTGNETGVYGRTKNYYTFIIARLPDTEIK